MQHDLGGTGEKLEFLMHHALGEFLNFALCTHPEHAPNYVTAPAFLGVLLDCRSRCLLRQDGQNGMITRDHA